MKPELHFNDITPKSLVFEGTKIYFSNLWDFIEQNII